MLMFKQETKEDLVISLLRIVLGNCSITKAYHHEFTEYNCIFNLMHRHKWDASCAISIHKCC